MKICPTCQRTYSDDGLNFCLDDGAVLQAASGQAQMPNTVQMKQPPTTNLAVPFGRQTNDQVTWNKPAQYSVQPRKSSKNWLWILGILALMVVLCSGSVGILALIGSQSKNDSNRTIYTNNNSRAPGNAGPVNKTAPSNSEHTAFQTIDLSTWVRDTSSLGSTNFRSGELTMGSLKKNSYYVLVAADDYQTEDATTRVTLKNANQTASNLGYGLIFHSNPSPLLQDYAFLIDTVKKRYRVVYHAPQKETPAINWTNSSAVKDGAQANIIEVKDENGSMDFYINGEKVNTLRNSYGYKGGVAGLYSGDGAQISFSNMEIDK